MIWDYFVLLPSLVKGCGTRNTNNDQARNQDFMWGVGGGGRGGANEIKVDQTTEMYFLLSDQFI